MNKIFKTFVCLVFGAFMLSSCVSNVESDGVKAIRDAKAREINADANLKELQAKQVEIQNLQAELAYLKEKATHDLEVQVLIAQKEAELIQAQIDLYKAREGETNEKIDALQAELNEIRGKIDQITNALYGTSAIPGGILLEIANINKSITDKRDELSTATDEQKPIINAEIAALNALKTQKEAERDSKVTELEVLARRLTALTNQINSLLNA